MDQLEEGLHDGIENADYHSDRKYVSSTALKLLIKNPKDYYSQYILGIKPFMPQEALDFGTYVHALILEPHKVSTEFAIWNGSKRSGKDYEEFLEANKGKIILSSSQETQAKILYENYLNGAVILGSNLHEESRPFTDFFSGGEAEQTALGELDGVDVKVRFDYRTEGNIYDVKTTSSKIKGAEDALKVCNEYYYDLSAALYVDLAEKVTGTKHDFYFLFLSKNDGAVFLFKAGEAFLNEGRRKYKEAISRLKRARETGIYYECQIPEINPN